MEDSEIFTYYVKMAFFTMIKKGIESMAETQKEDELKGKYRIDLMSYQLMEIKRRRYRMAITISMSFGVGKS